MSIHSTPDENTLKICPRGGQYTFPGGIVLQVPKGAVTKKLKVSLRFLNPSDVNQSILDDFGFTKENLVAFIDGGSEEINFNLPVNLIIKAKLDTGKIPLLYEVINDTTCTLASNASITNDAINNEIIISVKHFSSFFVELIEDLVARIKCGEDPCRCKEYFVEQEDKDLICSNAKCQITESKLAITYKSCPGTPKEEFYSREVSDGCIPKLLLSSDQAVIPTNGQTSIKATVELDCEPLERQNINFSITGSVPADLMPRSGISDTDGKVISTFTAGDQEGLVAVNAKSEVSFYRYIITATGLEKPVIGPKITKKLTQSVDIQIMNPVENWSGSMSFDLTRTHCWFNFMAHYDIDININVYLKTEYISLIRGTAISTQRVSVTLSPDAKKCWTLENVKAPDLVNFIVDGSAKANSDSLNLYMQEKEDKPLFTIITCYICDPSIPCDLTELDHGSTLFTCPYKSNNWSCTGAILLKEGTHTGTMKFYTDLFSYKLTLHKNW